MNATEVVVVMSFIGTKNSKSIASEKCFGEVQFVFDIFHRSQKTVKSCGKSCDHYFYTEFISRKRIIGNIGIKIRSNPSQMLFCKL